MLNLLGDNKLISIGKIEDETKNILKMYQVLKFYISSNLNTSKDVFQQIDPDTFKESILYLFKFDSKNEINVFNGRKCTVENCLIYIRIMDIVLENLEKYPDKGKIYAKILRLKYFDKEKYCNEKISEIICVSRSTYYRYLKQATIIFGDILFHHAIPAIESMLLENKVEIN